MKESLGNAFLFNIVIVFVGVFCLLLVGSAAYSKAFKIKDSIIDIIEHHKGWNNNTQRLEVTGEINTDLAAIGYRTRVNECDNITLPNSTNSREIGPVETKPNYDYCIYRIDDGGVGTYYKVVTFMRIDLPLLGQLGIPVSGETMTFRNE